MYRDPQYTRALEELIAAADKAVAGDWTGLDAAIKEAKRVARGDMKVRPMGWREIDPDRSYVGTGLGFTAEVRRMHSGLWEGIWPDGRKDFAEVWLAKAEIDAAYAKTIWDQII